MKTRHFVTAMVLLALGACTKQQEQPQLQDLAVGFDAYTSRGVTKAGTTGATTTATLQAATGGFGVFAYYTDISDYDATVLPNFMYNQKVSYATSAWTYSPVKYWPNEYGPSASSDDIDKISFFAYAPYVEVTPTTGKLTDPDTDAPKWGISGLSRNSVTGDPVVKYQISFDAAKSVDLVWGVVPATFTWNSASGTAQTFTSGKPWVDVERPSAVDQTLKFDFRHALTQLNVQVDVDPDITTHDETTGLAANTKVYIRQITFSGFAIKGALNLNNPTANKAYWLDYDAKEDLITGESVTIFDGRKDGKEGVANAIASNEKVLGLNTAIISNDGNTSVGVTKALQNLFNGSTAASPVFVIPTGDNVSVTIVYDVETKDDALATYLSDAKTHGSSVENVITKAVTFGTAGTLENGKKYTLKLHLGLNSVQFDAAVAEWDETTPEGNTNLP